MLERVTMLKKAEAEIKAYRAEMETKFKEQSAADVGSSAQGKQELAAKTEADRSQVRSDLAANKTTVVDMLLKTVGTVEA